MEVQLTPEMAEEIVTIYDVIDDLCISHPYCKQATETLTLLEKFYNTHTPKRCRECDEVYCICESKLRCNKIHRPDEDYDYNVIPKEGRHQDCPYMEL